MNIIEFLKTYLDIGILTTLGLMSFLLLWLVIERWLFLYKVNVKDFVHEEILQIALTKNLTTISSIGANAPYVGLLGTVLGILITFYDIGHADKIQPEAIMLGLALALKATALGLFVAIPAILMYNAFGRRVEVKLAEFAAYRASS